MIFASFMTMENKIKIILTLIEFFFTSIDSFYFLRRTVRLLRFGILIKYQKIYREDLQRKKKYHRILLGKQ